MLTPNSGLDEPPRGEHQKWQGGQFHQRQTQGMVLAGTAEGERKGQQGHRRYRDGVPLALPCLVQHALRQQIGERRAVPVKSVAGRVVVGRDDDQRDKHRRTDQNNRHRDTGKLGALGPDTSADAITHAGGIIGGGGLARHKQQAGCYSGDGLTHSKSPSRSLVRADPRTIQNPYRRRRFQNQYVFKLEMRSRERNRGQARKFNQREKR